jgi:hypothetical protein
MSIHVLRSKATDRQIEDMLVALETYIKLAVDIERGVIAGGGVLHADCEAVLIDNGGTSENIWGADWIPSTRQILYEALINIRPQDGNPSMSIVDAEIRVAIEKIVQGIL